jgi:DNA phosphorothioation-dependent restriction protein DptG
MYVEALEKAFDLDIGDRRFIAYLQLHEYETMLFADLDALRRSFDHCDEAIEDLKRIAQDFHSIEHIDDGATTAPSKRIISRIPAYEGRKPTAGPDTAEFIGLTVIRARCPHVNSWLARLEQLWVQS